MHGIEQSRYRPLERMSGGPRRALSNADTRTCCCLSSCCMWLINCFKNLDQEHHPTRPVSVSVVPSRSVQYQAPPVTAPPRAASTSSCDSDLDHEQGTLLPKRRSPEPHHHHHHHSSAAQPASASAVAAAAGAAATATAAPIEDAPSEPPRHHRTGSTGSVRSRPDSSPLQFPKTASSSKPSKPYAKGTGPLGGGSGSGGGEEDDCAAAAAGLKQLLGDEEDDPDEDCCPTCLDPYDAGNPKIWTRCGHHFHMPCIYEWLERKETCPICESKMVFEEDVLL